MMKKQLLFKDDACVEQSLSHRPSTQAHPNPDGHGCPYITTTPHLGEGVGCVCVCVWGDKNTPPLAPKRTLTLAVVSSQLLPPRRPAGGDV